MLDLNPNHYISTREDVQITHLLRNMIDGYNNNSYTSNKRLQEDRQKYLEDYWGGTLDDFTKKKLSLYNLMFRLCYSTEEKYVNFFKELSLNLTNIGINEKYNDKKIQILKEIQEIYERSTLTEDPFLNFIHEFEKTYNSLYKLVPQHNALSLLKTIYRILEDVIAQKEKIFASGFKDPIKNEIFHEFQDEIPYNNPITIENLESVSIVEDFYQPKELKKKKEKLKKNTGKDDLIDIDVNCVEDLKNYFKEFMETYEGMIKTSREFWQMNLVEILEDLYGDKRDHEILEGLTLKLYNDDFKKEKANALAQEAAEFLLKHRNEIRVFCKIKGVFEKNSPDKKDKIKKDKAEFNKPTNFQVKGVNKKEDYMIDIGNEDAMLVDNYEILSKILGDDLDKEMKNKEKNKKAFQDKKHIDVVFNEEDFTNMDQHQLINFYPFIEKSDQKEYIKFKLSPKPRIDAKTLSLINVSTLEPWAQAAFEGVTTFNPIQSKVFSKAFQTDDNLLICAPTGAGKTNVALLSIMRELEKHVDKQKKTLISSDFKIVYISPMKALAAEIVEKFSTKLKYLNVIVKELTGDIQLSKQEILDTNIIVTTPEKWDVVTRKSDGISTILKVLIIDEIHLLNDERGPVLECLVARTLMSIERLQSQIRLVGLSATLPNYLDVAGFLGVSNQGVFFFDQSYRPVPLIQNYIGVKDPYAIVVKAGGRKPANYKRKKLDIYNDLCYELVKEHVKNHKQVMVFVHSRKDTLGTANVFIDKIKESSDDHYFKPHEKADHREKIKRLSNKALQKIIPFSIGIHNAGLLRKDRNIIEKLFMDGYLRVLVTTATLAWGVNLPAYAVIIKGTDIYDPKTGTTNLSVLDVQQIFGRAGRPQFDTEGDATLMTDFSKVSQYMGQLNNAGYIESKFLNHLKEALNAEIVLGNVTSEFEAMDWLKYTYFNIRFRRNPIAYQFSIIPTIERTYQLEQFMQNQLQKSIAELNQERLIRFDNNTHFLSSTELGRITSHFYIRSETMAMFCEKLGIMTETNQTTKNKDEYITEFKLLSIMAKAKEFENLKVREEETFELRKVLKEHWIFEEGFKTIKRPGDKNIEEGVVIEVEEKILILISGYLKQYEFDCFSLVIDTQYVIQNSIRILRCILEITFKKNLANLVDTVLKWCKFLEARMIPYQSPLRQFCKENNQGSYNTMRARKEQREGFLESYYLNALENQKNATGDYYTLDLNEILEMDAEELAFRAGFNNPSAGRHIKKYASYIPRIKVTYNIKPITSSILKITLTVLAEYEFTPRWHSKTELFLIYVHDEAEILHNETIAFTNKHLTGKIPIETSFFVPYRETENHQYNLVVSSDRWVGSEVFETIFIEEEECTISEKMNFTKLLELTALGTNALNNPLYESLYRFKYFNPIQTQIFHPLYHTDNNVLIGAPTGSGKTIMAEFAMFRLFNERPELKIVYIAPLKALARERVKDWKERLENTALKKKILELTGDYTPDIESLLKADILITTPEKWDGISRNWQQRAYVQKVGLIIFDEIHLLGQDRGPVIEVIVSRMNYIADKLTNKIRMIGLSTAMANGSDVANWFGVPPYFFFNFKPHLRPVPITIYFSGFPEKHYCPRMATMNKPAYNAIKSYSDGKPVLIFVSSRRQTRLTALDLIGMLALEFSGQYPYLKISSLELDYYLEGVKDSNLKQTLSFGIGMHHAGLVTEDRQIVEELFVKNKIQVLIATSTLAWGVNFPARLVIVKGTEYYDAKNKKYIDFPVTDLLQMIGRAGRPQFDDKGIACVYVEQSKKNFYRKYLNEPFPIESNLISQLPDNFNAEIASGTLTDKQSCIDYLSWTYFFRRLIGNPKFYGLEMKNKEPLKHKKINDFLVKLVDESLKKLSDSKCIKLLDEFTFEPLPLGFLASFYYIKHETINFFEKSLNENLSLMNLVDILSKAKEFDEVPVRHNEDNYNEGLAKICPYPVNKKTLDSPNTKTNLLLQAHFSRLPLPIRDYLTDMKLVLDSSIRIIHAMIDLATDKGFLNITLNLMYLMQMIIQGVWIDDSGLRNITHFDQKIISNLWNQHKVSHLCQLVQMQKEGKLESFLQTQSFEMIKDSKAIIQEIIEEIRYFPDICGLVKASPFDSEKMEIKENEAFFEDAGEAMITLHLNRQNSEHSLRVKTQKGSKQKDCSWWIVVGDPHQNKVLIVKKTFFKTKISKKIQINLPKNLKDSPFLNVYLISDSYMGLDQLFTITLEKDPKKNKNHN